MSEEYDPPEVRRVLLAAGVPIGDRGKISDANKARYREIVAGGAYDAGVTVSDFDRGDDPGPVLPGMEDIEVPAGAIDEAAGPGGYAEDQADDLTAERTPRGSRAGRVPVGKMFSRGSRGTRRARGGRAKPRAKKTSEWVPVGPVIERFWGEAAWSLRKMPPLQRIMAAQAPMVGVVLQDATRDTFVDRLVLQRVARGEDRIEAINAVFGPLFWTSAIVRFGGTELAPVIDPETGAAVMTPAGPLVQPMRDEAGNPVWNDQTKVMIGGLRFSLMSWLRVGQRRAEEIIARAEELDELGDQADALIAYILSPPKAGQSFRDMQAEARAQAGFYNGQAPAAPAEGGASSAAEPARTIPGTVVARGEHPYPPVPPGAGPDPRTLQFLPPDAAVASQVVPRAPMAQA